MLSVNDGEKERGRSRKVVAGVVAGPREETKVKGKYDPALYFIMAVDVASANKMKKKKARLLRLSQARNGCVKQWLCWCEDYLLFGGCGGGQVRGGRSPLVTSR